MPVSAEHKKLHFDLTNVGLRAQATAAGLVQLCKELQGAGVLDDAALHRIKGAIADDIVVTAPRSARKDDYRMQVCERLDLIFSGEQKLGKAENLTFASEDPD
jgi:hypothetical protein